MQRRILIIDHYDSFVYNLARYVEESGSRPVVYRCDMIGLDDIKKENPLGIILSPGPGTPQSAGISLSLVRRFASTTPILGVCLGHQVIAEAMGATITRATRPLHGQATPITHDGTCFFEGLPTEIDVGRYHSLIVSDTDFPSHHLRVTARSEEHEIMAIAHRRHPLYGVQFHLESIMTEHGHQMMNWFLSVCEIFQKTDRLSPLPSVHTR